MTHAKMARLTISLHDLSIAQDYIESYSEFDAMARRTTIHEDHAYMALVEMIIIAYARPYSGNERRTRRLQAESKLLLADLPNLHLSQRDMRLHRKIIRLRNKAVAHSSFRHNPTRISRTTIQSRIFSVYQIGPIDQQMKRLARMILRITAHIHQARSDYLNQNPRSQAVFRFE